jgi:pyruvate/2-oxoglutarate dehydrogenase complex dihydrolipoamide acyltransferase (E2) component
MPDIGAGSQPMRVAQWLADPGSEVVEGDRLVEILTGGVLFSVNSPWTGRLVRIHVASDTAVESGTVLATMDIEDVEED